MYALLLTPIFQTFAAVSGDCASKPFFGLVPWYHYLDVARNDITGRCEVSNFKVLGSDSSFLLIALAIVDDLLRIAALVAVGYVLYGAIVYITSQGTPDATSKAQQTIVNALIGLALTLISVGFITFLGSRLGG